MPAAEERMKIYGQSASAIIAKIPGWAWGGVALILSVSFSLFMMRDQIDKWNNAEAKVIVAEQKAYLAEQKATFLQEQVTVLKTQVYEGSLERELMRKRMTALEERVAGR